MRTKIGIVLLTALTVSVIGYVAYRDLLFDKAAAAEGHIAAVTAAAAQPVKHEQQKPTPELQGFKRAAIALQEYRKGVAETSRGCNCGPDINKYTQNRPAQWCAMFVSWVANEAGSPLYSNKTNSWRINNSRELAKYLEQKGTWYPREQVVQQHLQPRVGDLLVFWRGNYEDNLGHVDVVVAVDDKTGTADLIGGNIQNKIQYRESFQYLKHYGFLGFGRPEKG